MNKRFKTLVWLLVTASVIYAVVDAHILGVEVGVNSQLPRIKELEAQIDPLYATMHDTYYTHPLRGALSYSSFVLVISWFSILLPLLVVRLGRSD